MQASLPSTLSYAARNPFEPMSLGNSTQLVFCRENVDPDVISSMLELTPTEALKVGDPAVHVNGAPYVSHLGLWKLTLPNCDSRNTVEEQIALWIELLRPRSRALARFREMDYAPYLDCKAEAGSLSLCIEPDSLKALGDLHVSLSVWLFEQPHATPVSTKA